MNSPNLPKCENSSTRAWDGDARPLAGNDPLFPALHVAVFLVDADKTPAAAGAYMHTHKGQALIPMLINSVERLYPNARFTILSSPGTTLPELPDTINVMRRALSGKPLNYDRMQHYIAFLEQAQGDSAYLFLDSDILMLNRLHLDVGEDWDVAIAYKRRGMWINSGMLLVRADRREQALAFLRKAARIYEKHYLSDRLWGADQAALRDAIGMTALPTGLRLKAISEATVLLLPLRDFAPLAPWYARLQSPNTWLIHFCGERKKAMPDFYWLRIGNNQTSEMKNLVPSMGEGYAPRRLDATLFWDMLQDIRRSLKPWRQALLMLGLSVWRRLAGLTGRRFTGAAPDHPGSGKSCQ